MKKFFCALAVAFAASFAALAAEQYNMGDYITYTNGKDGYSYIAIGDNVSSLTLRFGDFGDWGGSSIGYYTYTGSITEKERDQLIKTSGQTLGKGSTTLSIDGLSGGMNVAFYFKMRNGTVIKQFDFFNANPFNLLGSSKLPNNYQGASAKIRFSDYSKKGYLLLGAIQSLNDWVNISSATVRIGSSDSETQVDVTFADSEHDGEAVVTGVEEVEIASGGGGGGGPSKGAPLPGVLAVLMVAGGCCGVARFGRRVVGK